MDVGDVMGADGASDLDPASDPCHAKGCALPATTTCDRCGRQFCATHSSVLVIQRREERSQQSARQDMLAHLPTLTETYILCSACRNKPVSRSLREPPGLLSWKRQRSV